MYDTKEQCEVALSTPGSIRRQHRYTIDAANARVLSTASATDYIVAALHCHCQLHEKTYVSRVRSMHSLGAQSMRPTDSLHSTNPADS